MTDFALSVSLNTGFAEAVARARAALAEQGFGVLTEIDIAATMKTKLDVDMPPFLILGACKPALAHRALQADPAVAVLLPCNVTVRSVDAEHTVVQAMDPAMISTLTDNPDLADVAGHARPRLRAALETLSTSAA